jgi:hypothetical protein
MRKKKCRQFRKIINEKISNFFGSLICIKKFDPMFDEIGRK